MATEIERRTFAVERLELREEGGRKLIIGHAAVFNSVSDDLGGFTEKVAKGAFKESLAEDDIRALWNHNPDYVLGRNRANTLRLKEDKTGLAIEIDPPDSQWARDMLVSVERGDVSQMSFGFRTMDDEWATKDGAPVRTLKKAQLLEVSPVTFPAYPQTDVSVGKRSLDAWQQSEDAKRQAAVADGDRTIKIREAG